MTPVDLQLPLEMATKLEAAIARIIEIARPREIILFGSYAQGRAQEGSDLDLLVVADTPSWVRLAAELREGLAPLLAPLSFDLLVCTPKDWEIGRRVRGLVTWEADRKGVRLYAA
jgi:predicted nucleotidyltransferase